MPPSVLLRLLDQPAPDPARHETPSAGRSLVSADATDGKIGDVAGIAHARGKEGNDVTDGMLVGVQPHRLREAEVVRVAEDRDPGHLAVHQLAEAVQLGLGRAVLADGREAGRRGRDLDRSLDLLAIARPAQTPQPATATA